jgi:hypothetical protein
MKNRFCTVVTGNGKEIYPSGEGHKPFKSYLAPEAIETYKKINNGKSRPSLRGLESGQCVRDGSTDAKSPIKLASMKIRGLAGRSRRGTDHLR